MNQIERFLDQVCRGVGGPSPLRKHLREELREHLDDRIASRIFQQCEIIHLIGPDRRRQ